MEILVTGGAGYIGSHTCVELLNAGYEVIILDNLSNSSQEAIIRVEEITDKSITFYQGDIRDREVLKTLIKQHDIQAVIHFAGLKAVGESCAMPLSYYDNNVGGTVILCQELEQAGIKKLVFSSSATVYGDPEQLPLTENMPLSATNPYGRSKLIIEEMLSDLPDADQITPSTTPWSITLLRYFNPVGAHASGKIGEDPSGTPNNLMPYITRVAVGQLPHLNILGDDYKTPDGTGVRDYIHVVDLAKGHVKAIERLTSNNKIAGVKAYNLGTGKGISVLEMVNTFAEINQVEIPYQIAPRRPGDIAACWANPTRAKDELNWQTELSLTDMVRDSWYWQKNNPLGYNK